MEEIMLVNYNKIRHLSNIHSDLNISSDTFDKDSNTELLRHRLGWIWDAAVAADYPVCFVATELYCAGFALECDSEFDGKPSIVLFIDQEVSFNDIEVCWMHENVHLNQLRSKHLVLAQGMCYWKGTEYDLLELPPIDYSEGDALFGEQVLTVLKYYAQPWEIEAQEGLWNTRNRTFLLAKLLIDKYGTCWKNEWNVEYRRELINRYGLKYAFRDLVILP